MRACSEPECVNPHRARGLCTTHWKRDYGKRSMVTVPCAACGTEVTKPRSTNANRRPVCSLPCRYFVQHGRWPMSEVPKSHPSRHMRLPALRPPLKTFCLVYFPICGWCGEVFSAQQSTQTMCSRRCRNKAARRRRRALERGAPGSYSWAQVMGLFLLFGGRCAYCRQSIPGQPAPDHVVPLSRGGSNDITNILPVCPGCNSEKGDRTVKEWITYRATHGRPMLPGQTWHRGDQLYTHLVLSEPTRPRWCDAAA